jgi:hypothetical protein
MLRMIITPDPHFWDSKEAENVGWHDALAELIDNSFDAGAMRVEIELRGKRLSVKDDGTGVKDVSSLVTLGAHRRQKTTSLGVYGVGLKDAWMYFAPKIGVVTRHAGTLTTYEFDRADLKAVDGAWVAPDPVTVPDAGTPGTTIYFDPLRQSRARPQPDTLDRLGWTFMPALEAGKQILFACPNRKPIKACQLPPTTERIEAAFEVAGKSVRLIVGIMADGARNPAPEPGLWHCYGHRVIRASTMGFGQYSASKMCGVVQLGTGWKLTPHKNDLSNYCEELEAGIYKAIEPMLAKASQLIEDIASRKLRSEIEIALNAAIADAKVREKRNGADGGTGAVVPANTGRKREKAAQVDETKAGSVKECGPVRRKRGVKIDWCQLGPERIGQFDDSANTVLLNTDNEFIAHAKATENEEALRTVAIGLICHHHCMHQKRNLLMFDKRDFPASWGVVMASLSFKKKGRVRRAK